MRHNVRNKTEQYDELVRLLSLYQVHGKLELFCWCTPKRCHAESIIKILTEMYKEELEREE